MRADWYDFENPPAEAPDGFKIGRPSGVDASPELVKAAEDALARLMGKPAPEGWAEEICKAVILAGLG